MKKIIFGFIALLFVSCVQNPERATIVSGNPTPENAGLETIEVGITLRRRADYRLCKPELSPDSITLDTDLITVKYQMIKGTEYHVMAESLTLSELADFVNTNIWQVGPNQGYDCGSSVGLLFEFFDKKNRKVGEILFPTRVSADVKATSFQLCYYSN